jgi:uncharacterized protein YukE
MKGYHLEKLLLWTVFIVSGLHWIRPSSAFLPALSTPPSSTPGCIVPPQNIFFAKRGDAEDEFRRGNKIWNKRIEQLQKYKEEHGHVIVPGSSNHEYSALGRWVYHCRNYRSRIPQEKQDQLTAMGFVWEGSIEEQYNQQWAEVFERLEQFNITHGHNRVPQNYTEDRELGLWVMTQRRLKRMGTLKPEREEKLNSMYFEWQLRRSGPKESPKREDIWFEKLANLTKFHEENGHYWPSPSSSNATIRSLGYWTERQRKEKRKSRLRPDRVQELDRIGFPWDDTERNEAKWFAKFENIKEIVEQRKRDGLEGSAFVLSVLGRVLYRWCMVQKLLYAKGNLDPKRKDLLDGIGFEWDEKLDI